MLFRDYRGDVPISCIETFMTRLHEMEEAGISFVYVQYANLYLMAVTRCNSNATAALLFLHKVVEIFKHYFTELEEESLRDNFVIAYELLDEVMDYGYPQFTEARVLAEYIKTEAYKSALTSSSDAGSVQPPSALTGAVSWRSEGLKYKKNEIFLDVVESVHMLLGPNGQVIRSEIVGALKMRAYLSGMPDCKLGLNDKVLIDNKSGGAGGGAGGGGGGASSSSSKSVDLEDVKFHQCVRLTRFDTDRTISFVPPDGAFDLMTYRMTSEVAPLIVVECLVERFSRTRIEYTIRARSTLKDRNQCTGVELVIPMPSDAMAPTVRANSGLAEYYPEREAVVWQLKQMTGGGGGKEYICRTKYGLPSVDAEERASTNKPIRVTFEVPHLTVSGIQVRYLKVIEKSGYHALPWVRYLTIAGDYEARMQG